MRKSSLGPAATTMASGAARPTVARFLSGCASTAKCKQLRHKGGGGGVKNRCRGRRGGTVPTDPLPLFLQVSQGDATEKLAHQVPAQVAAAHRRLEEASGDPHAEEKDEAHKSSKGHVSGK